MMATRSATILMCDSPDCAHETEMRAGIDTIGLTILKSSFTSGWAVDQDLPEIFVCSVKCLTPAVLHAMEAFQ